MTEAAAERHPDQTAPRGPTSPDRMAEQSQPGDVVPARRADLGRCRFLPGAVLRGLIRSQGHLRSRPAGRRRPPADLLQGDPPAPVGQRANGLGVRRHRRDGLLRWPRSPPGSNFGGGPGYPLVGVMATYLMRNFLTFRKSGYACAMGVVILFTPDPFRHRAAGLPPRSHRVLSEERIPWPLPSAATSGTGLQGQPTTIGSKKTERERFADGGATLNVFPHGFLVLWGVLILLPWAGSSSGPSRTIPRSARAPGPGPRTGPRRVLQAWEGHRRLLREHGDRAGVLMPLTMLLGSMTAYVLARYEFPATGSFSTCSSAARCSRCTSPSCRCSS